jgi:hypothetical protein
MIGKPASQPPELLWWKVLAARDHGGMIHGARREAGDVFQAASSAMTFEVLEGLVEKTDAPSLASAASAPTQPLE